MKIITAILLCFLLITGECEKECQRTKTSEWDQNNQLAYSIIFHPGISDNATFFCPGCPAWVEAYLQLHFQFRMEKRITGLENEEALELTGTIQLFPGQGEMIDASELKIPSTTEEKKMLNLYDMDNEFSDRLVLIFEQNLTGTTAKCDLESVFDPCPPEWMEVTQVAYRKGSTCIIPSCPWIECKRFV